MTDPAAGTHRGTPLAHPSPVQGRRHVARGRGQYRASPGARHGSGSPAGPGLRRDRRPCHPNDHSEHDLPAGVHGKRAPAAGGHGRHQTPTCERSPRLPDGLRTRPSRPDRAWRTSAVAQELVAPDVAGGGGQGPGRVAPASGSLRGPHDAGGGAAGDAGRVGAALRTVTSAGAR